MLLDPGPVVLVSGRVRVGQPLMHLGCTVVGERRPVTRLRRGHPCLLGPLGRLLRVPRRAGSSVRPDALAPLQLLETVT